MDKKDKVLDLPMRKCFALQILKGEKVREYRLFTDHWATRMGEFNDPEDRAFPDSPPAGSAG